MRTDSNSPPTPLEVVHGIIDVLKYDVSSLKRCSLVSKSWHCRSRRWLFETIVVKSLDFRFDLVHSRSPDLFPVARYARTLHLVQYPPMRWMEPGLLLQYSNHFSTFVNVTSLTIDSLSIYLFNQADLRVVFGHFFNTVTELSLDAPESTPQDLIAFLRHFSRLDNLSISDPEWVRARRFLFHPRRAPAPFSGSLELAGLCPESDLFMNLLSELPLRFRQLSILRCSLEASEFDPLLDRLGESLEVLTVSAWFGGFKFPAVKVPQCTRIEEIHFFAGMIPCKDMPFQQVSATLDSVASTRVKRIVLDLNVDRTIDLDQGHFLRGLGELDKRLCRVAELSATSAGPKAFTVTLSTLHPFLSLGCLLRIAQVGVLVIGTRYRDGNSCGEVLWLGEYRGNIVV